MIGDRYREDLDRAVSFSGRSHEFFALAKADELLQLARRHLGDPNRLDALDVGCGVGLTDQHLRHRLRSLTGADVAPDALAVAGRENPGVRYELADGDRLPFHDDAFDLTFAINVVQVVPPEERQRFAAELARVTRPAGLVALFEHNPYNPLTRLVVRRFESPDDIGMLSMRNANRLLRAAGLTPVDAGYLLLFPARTRPLLALERALRGLPLGAQYYVAARPG